nr:hypothetical protein [Tanacetum cinerariifolium]
IVMANPNPENLNVPNEDVLEEDPHHLLDYDEEEDPKIDIEEEEPEEDPVEEPKPLAGHGDQFDAHPNPQLGNMKGKVVERLKVLESEENETLRKKLAKKEVLLDLTRMERDRAEKSQISGRSSNRLLILGADQTSRRFSEVDTDSSQWQSRQVFWKDFRKFPYDWHILKSFLPQLIFSLLGCNLR